MDLNVQITIVVVNTRQLQCMPLKPAGGGVGPECPRSHDMLRWQYWHPSARKSTAARPSSFGRCLYTGLLSLVAEANVAISLAATGECSSCQCLSASALLVVFPVACPYSSLFVTAFRSRRIVVYMYRL